MRLEDLRLPDYTGIRLAGFDPIRSLAVVNRSKPVIFRRLARCAFLAVGNRLPNSMPLQNFADIELHDPH